MPAVLLVVQAWLSLLHTVSASSVSNGTSQTFVDLWPIRGQPGQYRFPSFISTRKSVLLFASGPRGVEIRRSTDSGGSFSTPWQMRPTVGVAQAMYDPGTDAVLVLHRHPAPANGTCEQICGRWVSKSTDDGSSFSDPIQAGTGDIGATWGSGLAHGIALQSGRLAAAYRTDCSDRGQPGYHCTDNFFITDRALLSNDSGATWYAGGPVPHAKRSDWTESNLAELANGSVVLTSRMFEHTDDERSWAISHDGAVSWAKEWHFSSRQTGGYGPEGNTEGSLLAAKNGSKLLFAHPTTYSLQVGGGRDNLTVSESDDGGASWTTYAWGLVYPGGSAYSDMALLPNGSIGVAWERGRYQYISFAVLTPPWAV